MTNPYRPEPGDRVDQLEDKVDHLHEELNYKIQQAVESERRMQRAVSLATLGAWISVLGATVAAGSWVVRFYFHLKGH